ncbi:MAG: shikimate dehydrogenase [Eubacterium sp.]|nr:shikimate dehydrogenase [Eubacterium sp.]
MDYGLIGGRLGHSYSKEIHEKLAGYSYELMPLSEDEFAPFMEKREFKAINVTIPYKKKVIPYLKQMDDRAFQVGAVNTIVNRGGELYGYNTDYGGFLYMLKKHDIEVKGRNILIIGNGGAAAAVKACLRDEGAARTVILMRRKVSEDEMMADIPYAASHTGDDTGAFTASRESMGSTDTCVSFITYDVLDDYCQDIDVIVNTSPVGMYPDTDSSPLDPGRFKSCGAVVDLIYNPEVTKLCEMAAANGMKAVTGLEMLIAQAKYAVEIFLDEKIDEEEIEQIYRQMHG